MGIATLAKGLLTWIPGVAPLSISRNPGAAGGTASASYCYGVWMKHLALAGSRGMAGVPRSVLELGPGASIGTGLAALMSGAQRYVGLDTVRHLSHEANLAVFWELARLFRARAPRPRAGFPCFDEFLDARLFPGAILDERRLERALAPERLERLEAAVRALRGGGQGGPIRYHTWTEAGAIAGGSIDFAFSHVVMNHVEDLAGAYAWLGRWLAPGGWMTHQVDFTSLGTTRAWNGHLAYSDLAWKILAGRRPYFMNREPLATHTLLMKRHGFEIVDVIRGREVAGLARAGLARRWQRISDDDLATRTAFVIARRL